MTDHAKLLEILRAGEPSEAAGARAGVPAEEYRRARDAYLRAKLPPAGEELAGPVGAAVEIVRDRWGIPHVFAEGESDALLGLGYCMGRDRLWQLEYLRREALGTLAELLGPGAHDNDLRMRTIDVAAIAEAEAGRLDGATAGRLDAFVAGINRAIEAQRGNWPVELDLLDREPGPWTGRDTLAVLRAFWWQLTGRLENIVAAEAASRHLGDGALLDAFLTPELPDERIVPAGAFRPPAGLPPAPVPPVGIGEATGSNNWVVAGERTTTGAALLASDPHLPFVHPSDLYEAHLSWPGHDAASSTEGVVGAHYVGAPGALFGHNGRIAWGLTNNAASPRDLYVEEVNPANPDEYRRGDRWVRFRTRAVEIRVRGEGVRRHQLRATDLGPVMNATVAPVDEAVSSREGGSGRPLSMRWVGSEHLDDLRALLAVQRAVDWAGFRAALADWSLPIFNWVYADAGGAVGYQCAGRVPLRGRVVRGYRRADEPADRWLGYVPYDALPRVERPRRGFHATANNRVATDDYPYPLYGAWAGGNRALRIRQRIEAVERVSPEESRDLQNDVYLIRAARMTPHLLRILDRHSPLAAHLASWDYEYTLGSTAPTVFEALVHCLAERVVAARFPRRLLGPLHGSGVALAARLLEGEPLAWFEGSTLEAEVRAAAREAHGLLTARLGADWSWGKHHTIAFEHPLAAAYPALGEVANVGPAPVTGTGDSVRNAAGQLSQGFRVVSGAEYRLLVDFAARPAASATNTLGQSGQPGSAHFADQFDDWVRGAYHPLLTDRGEVERQATGRALIKPV
ncbi:MAG TPA: penicillin acylase family protein [Chloroflexota bacterium]|nr:penicillin acylase family protein [Chloroflexota bacterium]